MASWNLVICFSECWLHGYINFVKFIEVYTYNFHTMCYTSIKTFKKLNLDNFELPILFI